LVSDACKALQACDENLALSASTVIAIRHRKKRDKMRKYAIIYSSLTPLMLLMARTPLPPIGTGNQFYRLRK
jgi:hypothetical protein